MNDMKQACCPFCGSDDISAGEVLTASDQGLHYTQSECQDCGALGPRGELPPGDIDYGDVKAIAAWNRRTQPESTKPAQDLSAAILALPLPETNYNAYSDGSEPLWNKEHIAHILNEAAKIASRSSGQLLPTMVTSDMMNAGADAMREGLPMLNRGRSYQSVCKKVFEAMLALASPADALVAGDRVDAELLRKLRDYIDQKSKEYGYGFYRPANPHDFTPDADQCSEDEIAAHKAACEAFDKGEYTHDYSGCLREGGMHILHAPWGVGSHAIRDPEVQELLDAINAAIQAQKDGHGDD